ncbi:MAG TPA: type II toxin-antitoxin system PemK/MazF family toxin [archaeon]|nr:type II toxin-antitoxin system PemK/MazF family toxin [archaeon]
MSSSNFNQGEIIIAPIPFSNLVQAKLRPALVISSKKYNNKSEDIIVLKITSKGNEYPFDIALKTKDLDLGELNSESIIQADFPVVLEKQSIIKSIAKINQKKLEEVKQKICELYEL